MSWMEDLLSLADWAMQNQDLRYRFLYAKSAKSLDTTPGIINALETSIVLAIYEAAIAKGYNDGVTIAYERAYPEETNRNPRRADLAFKDPGVGKNWAYVEVKCYGQNGKSAISGDIDKLNTIEHKSQRWILVYRVRAEEGRTKELGDLLEKNFSGSLLIEGDRAFRTITEHGEDGVCEIVLAKVVR